MLRLLCHAATVCSDDDGSDKGVGVGRNDASTVSGCREPDNSIL